MDAAESTDLDRFAASAQRVVDYLSDRTPLTDWSVSRIAGEEQVHLHVRGDTLLHVGDRVPWDETFCRRMLAGAPDVVQDASRDPAYADLPLAADIRAYAAVAIRDGDGTLFGTLCGARAEPLRSTEQVDRDLLGVFSDLLSDELALVRSANDHRHSAVLAEALANSDGLTGVMNRRGWDLVLAEAQERVDTVGDRAGVLMIDLDGLKAVNDTQGHGAGDALIRAAADALRSGSRAEDRIARYGGDEFGVYVEGVSVEGLAGVALRYSDALADAGVAASVGAAPIVPGDRPGTGVALALAEADAAMYDAKVRRRAAAVTAERSR